MCWRGKCKYKNICTCHLFLVMSLIKSLILTWLYFWPILRRKSLILIFNASHCKYITRQLCSATKIEIHQFVFWHLAEKEAKKLHNWDILISYNRLELFYTMFYATQSDIILLHTCDMYVCMDVCMYVCICVYVCVCMYVCMYVLIMCVYVCMCVCNVCNVCMYVMCVCVCVCVQKNTRTDHRCQQLLQ